MSHLKIKLGHLKLYMSRTRLIGVVLASGQSHLPNLGIWYSGVHKQNVPILFLWYWISYINQGRSVTNFRRLHIRKKRQKTIRCWIFKITLTLIIHITPVSCITPFTPANKQWVSHLFHSKVLFLQYTVQVHPCPLMVMTTTKPTNNHASHRTVKVVVSIEVEQFSHQWSL